VRLANPRWPQRRRSKKTLSYPARSARSPAKGPVRPQAISWNAVYNRPRPCRADAEPQDARPPAPWPEKPSSSRDREKGTNEGNDRIGCLQIMTWPIASGDYYAPGPTTPLHATPGQEMKIKDGDYYVGDTMILNHTRAAALKKCADRIRFASDRYVACMSKLGEAP
jgi:hypothetical protein